MRPHIHLTSNSRFERALVCGSPERAEWFAREFLKDSKALAKNREYHSYLGSYLGKEILVVSHGVGAAGAAICFQELIDVGVKKLIRVGTAGGLQDDSEIGEIVIAESAIRKDGVTRLMVAPDFEANADISMTQGLERALQVSSLRFRKGQVVTTDLFYPGPLGNDLENDSKNGALAVEMECSALYVIAKVRGVQAVGILVLDGNPLKWQHGNYDPRPERLKASMEAAGRAAIKVLSET